MDVQTLLSKQKKIIAKTSAKSGPKTYWSTKIRFLNKRKMLAIPPILADGKLVSDFRKNLNVLSLILLLTSVLQSNQLQMLQSIKMTFF